MPGVNLNPETFLEGGGLIDDVDVVFTEARFEMFDYNGKADEPIPALKITIDCAGDESVQYYSMGRSQDWMPSDDGTQLMAVGSATAIRMSTNGGIFLTSLVDSGFPAEKLGDDISVLDKLEAHMIQVPEPSRNLKKTKEQEEREKKYGPKTILVVNGINKLPWEKSKPKGKAGKPKTKTKPKSTPKKTKKVETPAADTGGDISERLTEYIVGILAEEGSVAKKDLPQKIFAEFNDDPDKASMVKTAFDDEFLEAGPWTYDDGLLVAG